VTATKVPVVAGGVAILVDLSAPTTVKLASLMCSFDEALCECSALHGNVKGLTPSTVFLTWSWPASPAKPRAMAPGKFLIRAEMHARKAAPLKQP
jgi:hypothetical protein